MGCGWLEVAAVEAAEVQFWWNRIWGSESGSRKLPTGKRTLGEWKSREGEGEKTMING